ncbi:MAG: hypothetical protein LLF97_03490 [Planctomycetaceae bacterium]|nr:hypothetical protein [Planctomycetaceae bacterium]
MAAVLVALASTVLTAEAATLTLDFGRTHDVRRVGAIQRWTPDGDLRRLPDPKAKIDQPTLDAQARRLDDGRWVFDQFPAGRCDLVIFVGDHCRIEGFQFAPVKDFDPFLSPAAAVDDATRAAIADDIARSPHYENRVAPLAFAGDRQTVRVLMMLLRDRPTSYESQLADAATLRHELWQFTWQYGGWQKEKRTKVLDRVMLPREQLRQWTWLWDPELGGLEAARTSTPLRYDLPDKIPKLPGLRPE